MSVAVSWFNNETADQFLKSSMSKLSLAKRSKKFPAGTTVILSNKEDKVVFGVATLANWEGTGSPCREHHLLDPDIYSREYAQYNKYELSISNLRILKNPVSYDDIRILVSAPLVFTGPTNMWKGSNASFASSFIAGDDQSCVTRFNIWARSLL
jgi:hypothetical protein